MAIIKTVELPSGAIGSYNKIVKIDIYPTREVAVLTVAVYASEEARDAGKNFMWHEPVEIPFGAMTQNPLASFYEMLEGYTYSPFKGGVADVEAPSEREVKLDEKSKTEEAAPPSELSPILAEEKRNKPAEPEPEPVKETK